MIPMTFAEYRLLESALMCLIEHGSDEDKTQARDLMPKIARARQLQRSRDHVNGRSTS